MILPWIIGIILTAQPMASPNQLTITKDGNVVTKFNQTDYFYPYADVPIIHINKYEQFLEELDRKVGIAAENAVLDQNGNIIPEKIGRQVHRQSFTEQVYSHYFNQDLSSLELPMRTVYPTVDSELLNDIRNLRIGRYVTSFNPSNKNRTNNIKLAANAINNYVVFPGETFSFNKVVGKRTKEKGYQRAKVIVRGEYSEDIGGGICQVSSTLFNAVDNAGLEITQRFSHSRHVPYIPPGRDATVSWYGPDFEFKNNYNQPVLIRARTLGGLLITKLYSSESLHYNPKKVPNPIY
ncbi:VanW family protein [Neobacillus sp. LXY-1]|uniref:VanW family protein n=1 Tax=Neobacillus sp. LXY-1 TaxID=3379133 RepID=UPI003EE0F2B4